MTDKPHPKNWLNMSESKVVPSEVELWINQAVKAGWQPKKPGKPFEFIVNS
ncbi:hypothetical protein [Calothrix sp. CCY 0018]|uniref:hypothetical protein n=1 Tax=Calothrix sp. CCY 0018 TaxID=3103864 RepID=UPI0039C643D1